MQNILSKLTGRAAILLGAASLSSLLLIAAPQAHAAAQGPFYTAELATPVETRQEILRGALFSCDGTSCVGTKTNSRASIVCASFVREFGAVTAFTAQGDALDADDLAKCNKRA